MKRLEKSIITKGIRKMNETTKMRKQKLRVKCQIQGIEE